MHKLEDTETRASPLRLPSAIVCHIGMPEECHRDTGGNDADTPSTVEASCSEWDWFVQRMKLPKLKLPTNTRLHIVIAGTLYASGLALPAHGAETAPIPDFSGIWGRNWFNFELPPWSRAACDRALPSDRRRSGARCPAKTRERLFSSGRVQPIWTKARRNLISGIGE
jgi:hypothetical protein